MNSKKITERYIAFLRGINVGGHHKIPMAELCKEMEQMNFENIVTLLNSGNIIFETIPTKSEDLEKMISEKLEKTFGFSVPTIIRKSKTIYQLFNDRPFKEIKIHKDIRLYVSFSNKKIPSDLNLPYTSDDNSFMIIGKREKTILSVLDLSVSKTPKAMMAFEKFFGREITTRNWNTIQRIVNKLPAGN